LSTASEALTVAAVLASAGTGAAVDLRTRRVPNALTLTASALGLTSAAAGAGEVALGAAFAGFLLGLAVMLPGHLLGGTGGGDVKLMGALGTWVGPALILRVFLYSAVAGGVLALAVAVHREPEARVLLGVAVGERAGRVAREQEALGHHEEDRHGQSDGPALQAEDKPGVDDRQEEKHAVHRVNGEPLGGQPGGEIEPPAYFKREEKPSDTMGFAELGAYIRSLATRGFDVAKLRVQLYRKLAFPMVGLVMTLLAVPFSFVVARRGALYGIGIAIVIAIVYWAVLGIFEALGNNALLHPALAAWAPNLIFGAIGLYLILTLET